MMQKSALNVKKIRQDFPILKRKVMGGKPLVYLDNAATTQKPLAVINAISDYYMNYNSNIHRAVHQLAEEATFAFEETRQKVARFINARHTDEIIFTRNATEAINLVAYSWGRANVKRGDRVVISEIEHHSNIVPWQILTQEKGGRLEYIGVNDSGYLKMHEYEKYLASKRVKLVSVSQMSNVLGTIIPVEKIIKMSHERGIPVLVDGAQSVPHMQVDVQKMDCDFMAFSAHKMLGPTGVGVLYVKREVLEKMPPFMGGGDMIKEVHKYETRYNDLPYKFEGGTPNIADVIGFGAAIDYLSNLGMDRVREHEIEITKYALEKITGVKGVTLYGPPNAMDRGGVVSFNIGDIHPHDLATIMNDHGVAIRSGHHCAQVLMERLDVSATSRASFYIYNTKEEVDIFIGALSEARRLFKI
ncbi:cysteine desulfurase [Nitrososphaera sp.]|uniref:cysteine desulfurase n=1 Tax=Nitrososphaera sp. TaxID=1971748 RepID=UPI00307F7CDA